MKPSFPSEFFSRFVKVASPAVMLKQKLAIMRPALGRSVLLVVMMLGLGSEVSRADIATWNQTWSGVAASPLSAATKDANLSGAQFTRSGLTGVSSSARYNSSGWNTTANYLIITLTPASGYTLNLNSATLVAALGSSATGPGSFSVFSSVNSYATAIGTFTSTSSGQTANQTITLPSTGYNSLASITFRIVGSATSANGGTTASGGTGGPSYLSVGGTVAAALPAAPTVNAATGTNSSGFTANWNAVSGATGYYLDVATNNGFVSFVSGYNNLNVGNVTSTNVTSLSGSTVYYYRLRAYNTSGASGNSNTNTVTTLSAGTPAMLVTLPGQASPDTGTPTPQTAGNAFSITVTATTDGTTVNTSYTGAHNVTFTLASGNSVSPGSASVNFTSGVGIANITLTNITATTITTTDGTIAGTASSSLIINPGAINSYIVTAASPQTVGIAFNASVTAKDVYGNTVTTDNSTIVTLSSVSGNVQFDGNGDSTFGDNTKTLVGGAFTISAKDGTVETNTLTATDANSKTGISGSIVVNGIPIYRSKANGSWNAATTWQISTNNGLNWNDAATTPSSADGTVTILNSVTNTATLTVDQVVVASGGTLVMSMAFTVADGVGDDIDVQSGGVLLLVSSGGQPSFNSGATARIESGGILRVGGSGLTALGTGVNAASYIYADGSILDYALASAFSSSGVTFFPNVDANTVPVFRVTANVSSVGAGSPTTFNGVFEVASGNSVSWAGTATKTFRNGIRGAGNVSQGVAGQFIISGATAELGGSGTLTLGANGVAIASGSLTTLTANKTVSSGAITVAGTLDVNGNTLTVDTAPVFTGAILTEINRSSSPGKIALSSGTLTYGGALTITNLGSSLLAGDSFALYAAPAFSGGFSSIILPALSTGLLWDTNKLATQGILDVYAFGTNGIGAISTSSNVPVAFLKSKILSLVTGGRGTLALNAISNPAHGSVTTNTTTITYTPNAGFAGSDVFYCTISDANSSVTAQVNVTVIDPHDPGTSGTGGNLTLHTLGGGTVRLYISAAPNLSYVLQTNGSVSSTGWGDYKIFTMPATGITNFDDTTIGTRFYRTVLP